MRARALPTSLLLLLLCQLAMAGGTVSFNLKSYSTPAFPFVDDNYPVTTGVVIADLNKDGIPDVAYSWPCCEAGGSAGEIIVKMGTGGGNLGPDVPYSFGADDLGELVAADINGDGWLDLLALDSVQGWISELLNNGDGTFRYAAIVSLGGSPGWFTLGDFNNDGKIDLAELGCDHANGGYPLGAASCTLYVGMGDGSLSFTAKQSIHLAGAAYDIQSADLNGDGKLDLVFVRGSVGVILWGRGDGTFSGPTYLSPSTTQLVDSVAVADFNNDGRLDLALLSGNSCRPNPDTFACDAANANTAWIYKNNGGTSFTLASHAPFGAYSGLIVPGDINGDLNQDLVWFNQFASGIDPVVEPSGGYDYALGLGNDTLGTQGTFPGTWISAATFRDMDGDSRADYAAIDWSSNTLNIGIQTGGWKNCAPPGSAKLSAKICGISNGATVSSPLLVKASGNSPAGVNQLQVWIDGKKQYVRWGDQLAKRFTLSSGTHRVAVVASDKFVGHATAAVNVTVP